MKRWLRRVFLALLLAANLVTPAMAQQMMPPTVQYPPITGTTGNPVTHNLVAPAPQIYPPPPVPMVPPWPITNMQEPAVRSIPGPPMPGPPEGSPWRQSVMACLNNKGMGCEATHNTIGCGSLYGQCIFFFGSCRQFFGDPCYPIQPKNQMGEGVSVFSQHSVFGGASGCQSCGVGW